MTTLLFSGCIYEGGAYVIDTIFDKSEREVREYIENKLHLTTYEIRDNSSNDWYIEHAGEEELSFVVKDYVSWPFAIPQRHLGSNYDEMLFQYYYEKYLAEGGVMDAFQVVEEEKRLWRHSDYPEYHITANADTYEDMVRVVDQLADFDRYLYEHDVPKKKSYGWSGDKVRFSYTIYDQNRSIGPRGEKFIYTVASDEEKSFFERKEEHLADFVAYTLSYGYPEKLAPLTPDEIDALLYRTQKSTWANYQGEVHYVHGATYRNYGLTYWTLYRILRQVGYPVEGDESEFFFIGVDGRKYTFYDDRTSGIPQTSFSIYEGDVRIDEGPSKAPGLPDIRGNDVGVRSLYEMTHIYLSNKESEAKTIPKEWIGKYNLK